MKTVAKALVYLAALVALGLSMGAFSESCLDAGPPAITTGGKSS